jgi:outer membrane protein assembly factor BamB
MTGVVLGAMAMLAATSLEGAPPRRPIRESMAFPADSQVARTLFTVSEYLDEERYEELTSLLVQLTESHGRQLVAVPGEANPSAQRYINVAQYCQQLLASLPPPGRAVCRKRLDPQARRWYEAWQAGRDESYLERIVSSAYVSSVGDDALWALAELAWERGDFSLANAYWSQLLPGSEKEGLKYPDPDFAAADVDARRLLCMLFSGQFGQAERNIRRFRDKYPSARGKLAGREGLLADLLDQILSEARTWRSLPSVPELETFGGSPERHQRWKKSLDIGPLRWSAAWPVHALPSLGIVHPADRGPLKSFPVIDGQRVFVSDGEAVRGWNLVSGEPAWPGEPPDPAVIYRDPPEARRWKPDRPCAGVPWQTLTLHRGRLYARMGSPLVGAARIELHDTASSLICLDVRGGQGKLVWKLSADELAADGPLWSFEGTPVVIDATAYAVLYRRQPEPEFALLAVDAAAGTVVWQRSIGSARPAVEDAVNRVSALLLTAAQGRLFLSTDQGAVVALSPRDGRLLWAVSYESQPAELRQGVPAHLQVGLLPPLYWNGLLFVAPNDSQQMFCLDADSGRIVWQRRMPERLRHLIGVTDQARRTRLIASGNSLWAFDIEDGSLGWRFTQSEPAERGYGHGLLNETSVLWPTREFLYQLDQATGEVQRKIPLRTPDAPRSGGNLAVADGLLLVVEPDGLAVYGEYGVLKERLKVELSQRPGDARLWQQLMNLEAAAEQWDAAEISGRRAWSLRDSLADSAADELRAEWRNVLLRQASRTIEKADLDAADRLYRELSTLALPAEDYGRLLWDWSRLDERRGEIPTAVARLHELLVHGRRARFELDGQAGDAAARAALERLLQQHGREPFHAVDEEGQRRVQTAMASGDVDAVRNALRDFPFLESAAATRPRLIQLVVKRRDWPTAWTLFDEWAGTAQSDAERQTVEQQRIAALETAGYSRSAQRRQRREAVDDARLPAATWRYVVRNWSVDLAASERVLIPEGLPPDDRWACVLASGSLLRAFDRNTAAERWRQPDAEPHLWALYGETNLLVATKEGLAARRLETGELIWRRTWSTTERTTARSAACLRTAPDRLLVLEAPHGVTALSTATGATLWEFRPPRGVVQAPWLCQDGRIVLQTLDPPEIWIVDAETGRLIEHGNGPATAWRHPPVSLGDGRYAFVTVDRIVGAWTASRAGDWTYRGGMSQAHADPWLFRDGDRLGLLIDGGTLALLDPASGERLRAVGLADWPIREPARQIAVANGLVVAGWKATLRAVSLQSGEIVWEQSLPPGIDEWIVQVRAGYWVVAGTARRTKGADHCLLLLLPDGRPVQMLQRFSRGEEGTWHVDHQGVVLATHGLVAAWEPMDEEPRRHAARAAGTPID